MNFSVRRAKVTLTHKWKGL